MQFRGVLLAASLLTLPIVASAQPVTGLYMGAGIGVALMQDEAITSVGGVSLSGTRLGSDFGPAGVVSLGWGFGNGFRAEIEGDFRANKFNKLYSGFGNASAGGWEEKFGGMVNVLYDFVGMSTMVQPYVGVGFGYQGSSEQDSRAYGGGASVNVHNGTDGSFAYQAIFGLAVPVAAAPGLAVTAEYRFMGLAGSRSYNGVGTPAGGAPTPVNVTLNDDYNHTLLVGIRYNFGQTGMAAAAASGPAPAAAVVPARSYLVFFDWDKATLSDRARQIIKEAADNSTHVQYTRLEVNGYTDTSGTPQYNMGLSVRRASAVKAELIKDGVPAAAIATQGFGETHLLVPTGNGAREPQNRRVEIIIH